MSAASLANELEDLERRGWEALSGPGGADFYREVMADDGLMLFPGMMLDKAQAVETMASVAPWKRYELSDVRVIGSGPDSAIVVCFATASVTVSRIIAPGCRAHMPDGMAAGACSCTSNPPPESRSHSYLRGVICTSIFR